MVVANHCPSDDEASAKPRGLLLCNVRDEWTKVFGNDISALMEKCDYTEVESLVRVVEGLRIAGEGEEARVHTTCSSFEAATSAPRSIGLDAAETGATSSEQRRRPPPPPPAAPAPVLTPSGAKVLNLDTFVQSPSGKVSLEALGWGGRMGYPGTPSMWGAAGGWDSAVSAQWQSPLGSLGYPPPPVVDVGLPLSADVPEPPSSSAL